ncbi:BF3164 family lipoprotein [uncultured Kordia sp.]|uniref:BF3164 family lipoprotein n=1 Tax=uncultured Kordia sp. TaxID=507699 RepID=UPI00261D5C38|nr:BF3164 family lipoprotein [uncultured Kordia sp.]
MIRKVLVLFLLIAIISCKSDKNTPNFHTLAIEETPKPIKGEKLLFTELVNPSKMIYKEPYLYLGDSRALKRIHVIDILNNTYVANIGIAGKGPGELLSLSSLDISNGKLWAYDLTISKLVSFHLDSLAFPTYTYDTEIYFQGNANQNFSPNWIEKEKTIVSTTFSESGNRLIFTNTEGTIIDEKFPMFSPPSSNIPQTIHNISYQSILKVKPDQSKVAIISRYADLLEIYDLKNNTMKRIKTHSNFNPIYEVMNVDGNAVMGQGEDTRFGHIYISASDEKIYTLYSGRTRGQGNANFADVVCVFDWEGNFITSYKIENRAIAIELKNDHEFFVIELDSRGEFLLKKYTTYD